MHGKDGAPGKEPAAPGKDGKDGQSHEVPDNTASQRREGDRRVVTGYRSSLRIPESAATTYRDLVHDPACSALGEENVHMIEEGETRGPGCEAAPVRNRLRARATSACTSRTRRTRRRLISHREPVDREPGAGTRPGAVLTTGSLEAGSQALRRYGSSEQNSGKTGATGMRRELLTRGHGTGVWRRPLLVLLGAVTAALAGVSPASARVIGVLRIWGWAEVNHPVGVEGIELLAILSPLRQWSALI